MKIAYLMQEGCPDVRQKPLTGPANHVVKVYEELAQLGHRMVLLARFDNQILLSHDLVNFKPVHVRKTDQGLRRGIERLVRGLQSRLNLPYFNFFESLRYAEACRQELADCDFFFERMGWMGYGSGLAARWLGVPLVLEVNNGDFITELERLGVAPQGFQRWLAIRLMQAAVRRASHVIATGDGHRQRFIEWWGVSPDFVTTVENGSEISALLPREATRPFQPPPAPDDPVTVVFVGAFEPWHGILILLSAMRQVAAADPRVRLVLIGSGTLKAQVLAQIDELNLQDRVELTGQLPIQQVAARLASADIGVAPYCGWMEFSGLKLFDYKSAGLATVASGQDGQPATLAHGATGWIVPPCDEAALAGAILHLANQPELRRAIGRSARLEAEQIHTWRYTASQISHICTQIKEAQHAR